MTLLKFKFSFSFCAQNITSCVLLDFLPLMRLSCCYLDDTVEKSLGVIYLTRSVLTLLSSMGLKSLLSSMFSSSSYLKRLFISSLKCSTVSVKFWSYSLRLVTSDCNLAFSYRKSYTSWYRVVSTQRGCQPPCNEQLRGANNRCSFSSIYLQKVILLNLRLTV